MTIIGQRPVDVVKLHTDHIYNGILHITQQKTKTKQRFEIIGKLAEIINRRLPENGGYLFRNGRGSKLTAAVLAEKFWDLRRKLMDVHPELAYELKNFQFRDLRAKSATYIFLSSTLKEAQEQLGHTSERMTQTYIRQTKLQRPIERICGTPQDFAEK